MTSIFGTYNIASSGMYVNQTALSVTSQNISNVNTSGYSRQKVSGQETVSAVQGGASAGNGVSVQEISRARNILLDQTYRQQNAKLGYWESKSANLENAQIILEEFSSDEASAGLQQTIEEFFSSWDVLASDPSSLSSRQAVIDCAESLIDTFKEIDEQLLELQYDAADNVKDGVAELNDLAQQVAELNIQIKRIEASGVEASELQDQRDTLLDNMSALANINASQQGDGMVQVSIGGIYLVQGGKTHTLITIGDGSAEGPLLIQWAELSETACITSGSIAANMSDADQSGQQAISAISYDYSATASSSIANLRQGLNTLLTTIASQVNSIHTVSMGLDGSSGINFFTPEDDSELIGINNIKINPTLQAETSKIAAGATGDSGDNSAALKIAAVVEKNGVFQFDGQAMTYAQFYQSLISWIGTAGSTASGYCETQTALVAQVENSRQSISSVSVDEELANMIMYQNAYSASARVLSTIDSLLADLIAELT